MTRFSPLQVARWVLGLSWIYQGIAPKILSIAPLEKELTGSLGYNEEISNLITRSAGVGEIIFGILLIVFYRQPAIHLLNMAALIGLLVFSIFMLPSILIEAFNPVTTNLCMIALSYYLWFETQSNKSQ